jgi:site-specific DNA-cytosine methylase
MGRKRKADLRHFVDPAPLRIFFLGVAAGGWAIGAKKACPINIVGAWEDDYVSLSLFRKNFGHASMPKGAPPHHDLAVISDEQKAWARESVLKSMPRIICMERKSDDAWLAGYKCYEEEICASEFGLAQSRKRKFLVAFRNDVNLKFSEFPFPDPMHGYHSPTKPMLTKNSKVTIPEALELMGYPDGLEMPDSRTATLKALSNDVCPPVAKAIIEEIWTWVS